MTGVAASALSRRAFIRTTAAAGGGLMLGVSTACGDRGGVGPALAGAASAAPEASFSPNVFVHLHTSGEVEIVVARSEMGQGVRTALSAVIADEMEAVRGPEHRWLAERPRGLSAVAGGRSGGTADA
jgi:isoquinoline 1-oxidoreductase beta subunit